MLSFLSAVVNGLCGFWDTPPLSDVNGQWAQLAGGSLPLGTQLSHPALETLLLILPLCSAGPQYSQSKIPNLRFLILLLENVAIMRSWNIRTRHVERRCGLFSGQSTRWNISTNLTHLFQLMSSFFVVVVVCLFVCLHIELHYSTLLIQKKHYYIHIHGQAGNSTPFWLLSSAIHTCIGLCGSFMELLVDM